MATSQVIKVKNYILLHDAKWVVTVPDKWFNISHWQKENAVLGRAMGRGSTWFVRHNNRELALRHYKRGGMVARLLEDRYLWLGLKMTRAWREWHLLAEMFEAGLPVPQPLAARVSRHGLLYSADLITARIPDTQSLTAILAEHPLQEALWGQIGATIARFHQAGYCHADLNANNILLDSKQQIFLIDFDRGSKRKHGAWRFKNLERLLRSLHKQQEQAGGKFHFTENDWLALNTGYETAFEA
ncbi:MAG: 3-deoxy-D-manno-octulosonic acid kinase [Gammaproteobacteria bacterium]|nr:3-deoxy-D-manno-octulosonic acid kinase [Gammaproteobacteria bacterium]MDH5651847.1 3-deoxy-D-manno-octulosonic acid kinase [Gammaproteobacteria bacterium]